MAYECPAGNHDGLNNQKGRLLGRLLGGMSCFFCLAHLFCPFVCGICETAVWRSDQACMPSLPSWHQAFGSVLESSAGRDDMPWQFGSSTSISFSLCCLFQDHKTLHFQQSTKGVELIHKMEGLDFPACPLTIRGSRFENKLLWGCFQVSVGCDPNQPASRCNPTTPIHPKNT